MKYFRITGGAGPKEIYQRDHALATASEHARHFLEERVAQVRKLGYARIGGTPDEASARIKTDVARWTKIIHDVGIQPQ